MSEPLRLNGGIVWKDVECPKCGVGPGESCGRPVLGRPQSWERVSPHASRKKAASKANDEPHRLRD